MQRLPDQSDSSRGRQGIWHKMRGWVQSCSANINHYFIVGLNCSMEHKKEKLHKACWWLFSCLWQNHDSFRVLDFHIPLPSLPICLLFSNPLDPRGEKEGKNNNNKKTITTTKKKTGRIPLLFSRFQKSHKGWEQITYSHSNPSAEVMSDLPLIQTTSHVSCLLTDRTTELLILEGTSEDHLVRPFCQNRVT